eukprot:g3295.t1
MNASKSNSADEETFAFFPKKTEVEAFTYVMQQREALKKTYKAEGTGELVFEMKNIGKYYAKTVTFTIVSKHVEEKKETILKPPASSVFQVRGKTALSTDQLGMLEKTKFYTSTFDKGDGTNSFKITVNTEHTVQFVVPVEMGSVVHLTAKLDWSSITSWANMPLRCFFREDIRSILADAKAAVMQTVGKKHWTRFFAQYRITRMRSASEKMEKVIAEQKDALEKKDAEIKEKDTKIGKLESKLAEKDKKIGYLERVIKRLREERPIPVIIDPNPELLKEIEVLKEENKNKKEEIQIKKKRIEMLNASLETAEKCIEELQKKVRRLNEQIKSFLENREMSNIDFLRKNLPV